MAACKENRQHGAPRVSNDYWLGFFGIVTDYTFQISEVILNSDIVIALLGSSLLVVDCIAEFDKRSAKSLHVSIHPRPTMKKNHSRTTVGGSEFDHLKVVDPLYPFLHIAEVTQSQVRGSR